MKSPHRNRFLAVAGVLSTVFVGLVLVGAADKDGSATIQARYHKVILQLAELDLQAAIERNREVPNSVAGQTVERLQMNIAVAHQLHERAAMGYGDMPEAHVLYADARAQLAASDYRLALKAREINPDSVPKVKLERLQLSAELAKLRLEMWKHPETISSLVDHMQWQIDQLSHEILTLQERIERLE